MSLATCDMSCATIFAANNMVRLLVSFNDKFLDPENECRYICFREANLVRQAATIFPLYCGALLLYTGVMHAFLEWNKSGFRAYLHVAALLVTCLLAVVLRLLRGKYDGEVRQSRGIGVTVWLWSLVVLVMTLQCSPFALSVGSEAEWILLLDYLTLVWLPLSWRFCMLSLMLNWTATLLLLGLQTPSIFQLPYQIGAIVFFRVSVLVLGCHIRHRQDQRLRSLFDDAKMSAFVQEHIVREAETQKQLLLSVIPQHIANDVLNDISQKVTSKSKPFRKFYVHRHENVSILFADIVGFTQLSSQVSAKELILIIGDMFATFDNLAQIYHQMRIKLLGDCYYCVCGAIDSRWDHAILSVHMGLAMIDATHQVRERTKTQVSMRVGIHTGAVLAGVVGLKKWQFDILGKDVTLANKMESGGIPGMVHISESTYGLLHGHFEVEVGNGAQREPYLKKLNVNTFLVKKVVIPQQEKLTTEVDGRTAGAGNVAISVPDLDKTDNMSAFEKFLTSHMRGYNRLTLTFHNSNEEKKVKKLFDKSLGLGYVHAFVMLLLRLGGDLCYRTMSAALLGELIICECCFALAIVVYLPQIIHFDQKSIIYRLHRHVRKRRGSVSVWLVALFVILFVMEFISMEMCGLTTFSSELSTSLTNSSTWSSGSLNPYSAQACLVQPWFLLATLSVDCLLLISFEQVNLALRWSLLFCFGFAMTAWIVWRIFWSYDRIQMLSLMYFSWNTNMTYRWDAVVSLLTIVVLFAVYARIVETFQRSHCSWRHEMDKAKEEVSSIREVNQQLLHNILPAHVAQDFLNQRRDKDALYYHEYEAVGVMFVACPNFYDFYNESDINNNGLECIRFLNEIIADFDELLDDPRFREVTKVKTIGATYMVASGLQQPVRRKRDDSGIVNHQHLEHLVQFAWALYETMERCNQHSFNQFKLRTGIEFGPVLAGVIGANKPHYDIWGNTVNVASRMESTGVLGKIQVTKNTRDVLVQFQYQCDLRGDIEVKGKGVITTYFLKEKIN